MTGVHRACAETAASARRTGAALCVGDLACSADLGGTPPKSPAVRRRRQAGFTLIEVMVAIALMAIVAILSWRGLESVSQAGARIDASAADTETVLRSVGQLARDVMLRAPAAVLPLPPAPAGVAVPMAILPASLSVDKRRDGSLVLGMVRGAVGEPGYWQRVAWSVDEGVLRRRIGLAASVLPLPPVVGAGAPPPPRPATRWPT
jgi:general secretion pathway protein J